MAVPRVSYRAGTEVSGLNSEPRPSLLPSHPPPYWLPLVYHQGHDASPITLMVILLLKVVLAIANLFSKYLQEQVRSYKAGHVQVLGWVM